MAAGDGRKVQYSKPGRRASSPPLGDDNGALRQMSSIFRCLFVASIGDGRGGVTPLCSRSCRCRGTNSRMMLAIEGLSVSYGGLGALRGVSVTVDEGQFVAIVGPNGAGKTTLFKAISGVVPAQSGTILYDGRDLLGVPPHERVHLGIAHVPEGRQVFAAMTVQENLEMGAYSPRGRGAWRHNIDRIFALFP